MSAIVFGPITSDERAKQNAERRQALERERQQKLESSLQRTQDKQARATTRTVNTTAKTAREERIKQGGAEYMEKIQKQRDFHTSFYSMKKELEALNAKMTTLRAAVESSESARDKALSELEEMRRHSAEVNARFESTLEEMKSAARASRDQAHAEANEYRAQIIAAKEAMESLREQQRVQSEIAEAQYARAQQSLQQAQWARPGMVN